MLFVKGWVPLADFTRIVFDHFRDKSRQPPPHPGRDASEDKLNAYRDECMRTAFEAEIEARFAVWHCIHAAPRIGVLCASGRVVDAGASLMESVDYEMEGAHVHIWTGTVGSASWMDDSGHVSNNEDKKLYYGPFLYCPVLLPEQHARDFFAELSADSSSPPRPPEHLADQIVAAFDLDPTVRKSDLRRQLAAHEKQISFEVAYQEAARKRPELNKRGPKRRIDGPN
ncbi:hypothetical protein [Frigidibacter sp. MR17.24]|uniref:hypothetical protein n=1 Tax=Frigidibacter sp. MR17.24 TaxID=3127345 RepID=UPI003012CEB9